MIESRPDINAVLRRLVQRHGTLVHLGHRPRHWMAHGDCGEATTATGVSVEARATRERLQPLAFCSAVQLPINEI